MEFAKRKRKRNRLIEFDYSQNGAYFITICVKEKKKIFWNYKVGATCGRPTDIIHLSEYGLIVYNEISKINDIYCGKVNIDKFVIMPNHIHLLISLNIDGRPQVAPTISRVVQQFKGAVTKKIGFSIWQKLFHDHIIRNENDYMKIWEYINNNEQNWEKDCYFV